MHEFALTNQVGREYIHYPNLFGYLEDGAPDEHMGEGSALQAHSVWRVIKNLRGARQALL
jgi:hypothetical protein